MGHLHTPRGRAKNLLGFGRRGVAGYQKMLDEYGIGPQRPKPPKQKSIARSPKPVAKMRKKGRTEPELLPAQRAAQAGISEAAIRRAYEAGAGNLTEAIEMAERKGWRNPKHHRGGVTHLVSKFSGKVKEGARTALGLYEKAYDTAVTQPLHRFLQNPAPGYAPAHGLIARPSDDQVRALISQAESSRSGEELGRLVAYANRMHLPDLRSAAEERARRLGIRMAVQNPDRIATKDPATMTAGEINKELEKLDRMSSQVTDEFIEAGRGNERPSDYLNLGDPLSKRARAIYDRRSALLWQIEREMGPGYHSFPYGWKRGLRKKNPQFEVSGPPRTEVWKDGKFQFVVPSDDRTLAKKVKQWEVKQYKLAYSDSRMPGWQRLDVDTGRRRRNPDDRGERSFALQFFTAGGGFGTTIQSARSRLKKWQRELDEMPEDAGTGPRGRLTSNIAFYSGAIRLYEELKRSGMTADRARAEYRELGARRRNPEPEADRLYESFHGRPADQTLEIEEEFHQHDHLATLGVFVNLVCHTLSGYEVMIGLSEAQSEKQDFDEESADEGTIFLASSEDGRQLYLVGGDQELDLDRIHMGGKWEHDDMIIGELVEITYRTRKKFDKFRLTDYYHDVGEDTGERAMLRYEPRSRHMYITGGQYQIKMPLIGMSAGIEN